MICSRRCIFLYIQRINDSFFDVWFSYCEETFGFLLDIMIVVDYSCWTHLAYLSFLYLLVGCGSKTGWKRFLSTSCHLCLLISRWPTTRGKFTWEVCSIRSAFALYLCRVLRYYVNNDNKHCSCTAQLRYVRERRSITIIKSMFTVLGSFYGSYWRTGCHLKGCQICRLLMLLLLRWSLFLTLQV